MRIIFLFLFSILTSLSFSQEFTRADTLRGSITPERAWWDVQYYDLDVSVNPLTQSLKGSNTITYKVLNSNSLMQIDLQAPMQIEKVLQNGKELEFTSEGDVHFITLKKKQKKGKEYNIAMVKILSQMPIRALVQVFGGL